MYYVYIIYARDYKRWYVGMTTNFEERLAYHNRGRVKSTKAFRPWELKHIECYDYDTRIDARKREKYLKSSAGRRWRSNNILE